MNMKRLVFGLFCFTISTSISLSTGLKDWLPASEYDALVALYNSTNGETWIRKDGWLDPNAVDWQGLNISYEYDEQGNVVRANVIDIYGLCCNNLNGSIPPELGNLTQVTFIDLQSNQLTGAIPKELAQLSQLAYLWLHQNQLTGAIPAELGNLSNMKDLELGSNKLSGSIPAELGNLSILGALILSGNDLSGSIPAELGNLSSLVVLDLQGNKLSGSIPAELGQLNQLQILDLSYNDLSTALPTAIGNLTSLTYVNFSWNRLDLTDPISVSVIKTLTEQGTEVITDPQKEEKVVLDILRCTSTAYTNVDGAQIDDALTPSTDPGVLASQPIITEGVIADGVTPLLLKIDLTSTADDEDKSAQYHITVDVPTGGDLAGGVSAHLRVLQDGVFVTSPDFKFGDDSSVYAYLTAINAADVQLSGATELNVTMHITSDSDSSLDAVLTFKIAKPPVVLVHGYASNSCSWSDTFLNVLKSNRPADFVYAIDYGLPGPKCESPNGNATFEPLNHLAFELDNVLATQVEDHENGRFADWAFTRYDLVCHSQGGILARMLCTNFPGSTQGLGAPYSRAQVVSKNNANRGRFRRVVTIGSPQNGSTLLHYVIQLGAYLQRGLLPYIPAILHDFAQLKFDPYIGQIPEINGSLYLVDGRIKFRAIRTKIGLSSVPLSYKLLGLPSIPPGESRTREDILLPQGSDGLVNFDSEGTGAILKTDYLPFDISHAPSVVFSVATDETQTRSYQVGLQIKSLLQGPPTSFDKFVLPIPKILDPSQADVDSIAASLTVTDIVISLLGGARTAGTSSTALNGSTSYTCNITPASEDPPDGEISWYAENRNLTGIGTDGVSTIPDANDPTSVVVTVDDSVLGDVVLYVQYMSQKGALVLGDPLLVVSRPPAPSPTGIDLGQSSFVLGVGDVAPLQLYADYSGGVRMLQYVSVDEIIGLQSSNASIVDVDVDRASLIAKTPGTATVTATFHGFTTQAAVTVSPLVPPPPQLLNVSTRMKVLDGDNVLIGGFIVTGADPKKVILRGIGPSLSAAGIIGVLQDPYLELHNQTGILASNENWKDTQQNDISATGIPPTNDKEAAILTTLSPGAYSVILKQNNGGTGIGLVEAYDLDQAASSKLANISTRGFVDVGDNVMIGGFIAGGPLGGAGKVLLRALGPSLTAAGVTGALQDPTIELYDGNGDLLGTNDNWKDTQAAEILATGIPPADDRESAIVTTLTGGAYTAIVRGASNAIGIGLVEAYRVDD